jgi:penicillin-binding protein 2
MTVTAPQTVLLLRLRLLLLAMLAGLALLGVHLWRMQILDSPKYASKQYGQSIRQVRLPGQRGRILDRHGVCLADNRPSFCVAIYVEELRQPGHIRHTVDKVESVVRQLSKTLAAPVAVTRADIQRHMRSRLLLPFMAWRDIDQRMLARISESAVTFPGARHHIPGVDIEVEPIRTYPRGTLASHVLGYVGKADVEQDQEDPFHYLYFPETEGKQGIEKIMDESLRGEMGAQLICVDALSFKYEEKRRQDPVPGEDVILAIDSRIQALAEQALVDDETLEELPGAAVVLDPRNGDVLAMASTPTFDPNVLGAGVSRPEWKALTTDNRKVLLNRAIGEIYAPGSVFKLVVAMAALDSGLANADTTFTCSGAFMLGEVPFRCWIGAPGHGPIPLAKGIEQSCNSYFCQLGRLVGHDKICQTATAMGIGRKSGIQLTGETAGILFSEAWKRQAMHDGWRAGDTCNLSIGQGAMSVTPLQMAQVTMMIANGGRLYRPRLVLRHEEAVRRGTQGLESSWEGDAQYREGELLSTLRVSPAALQVVRAGMHEVIHAERGTGKRALVPGLEMAGKTGTAEWGAKGSGKKRVWMAAYAPFDKPRVAAIVMFEQGDSGGRTVAPRMKKLMAGIFGISLSGDAPATPPMPAAEDGW